MLHVTCYMSCCAIWFILIYAYIYIILPLDVITYLFGVDVHIYICINLCMYIYIWCPPHTMYLPFSCHSCLDHMALLLYWLVPCMVSGSFSNSPN